MKIQYIKHSEIDFMKWDDCINRSLNGIVYAYSWYLDIVADEWDALVVDDYEAVFPLVKGRKYGISYIYQPLFAQQLGAFSPVIINRETLKLFVDSIPPRYRHLEISFNTFNNLEYPSGKIDNRVTYQLDLVQSYFALSSNYNENTRRNISKSIAMGVTVNKKLSIDDFIAFKWDNLVVALNDNHHFRMSRIINHAVEGKMGEIYAAYSEENELCAAAFFIRSNGKVVYLSAVSSELGKKTKAMFALVDRFINDYSESHLILDFEGSNVESIARFYAGFGATRCTYPQLKINNLPWFLKPFKR